MLESILFLQRDLGRPTKETGQRLTSLARRRFPLAAQLGRAVNEHTDSLTPSTFCFLALRH